MSYHASCTMGNMAPKIVYGAAIAVYPAVKKNRRVALVCSVVGIGSFAYDLISSINLKGQNTLLNREVATKHSQVLQQGQQISAQQTLLEQKDMEIEVQVDAICILTLREFQELSNNHFILAGDPARETATLLGNFKSLKLAEKKQLTLELRGHIQRLNQSVYNRAKVQVAEIIQNPETRALFHEHIPEATEIRLEELEVENTHLRGELAKQKQKIEALAGSCAQNATNYSEQLKITQKTTADFEDLKKLCKDVIQKNEVLTCEVNELKKSQMTPADREALDDIQRRSRPQANYDLAQVRQAAMNIALEDDPVKQNSTSEKSTV